MLIDFEIFSFAGHMHPLLVHLPIGILLAGLLVQWLSRNGKNPALRPALMPIYLAGCLSAFLSCISGYILSLQDDYDISMLNIHQWMGISVAVISTVLFLGVRGLRWFTPYKNVIAWMLFAALIYTAHLGGSLTHGSNFLFYTSSGKAENKPFIPLPNAQEAMIYSDIIQPILQEKCYSCHGPKKQKAKLRLDGKDNILQGGKNGKIIVAEVNEKPELLRRILLPPDDEDHMPPKEKGQLSERQIQLISWWIDNGANFTAKSREIPQNDTIKRLLSSLEESNNNLEPGITQFENIPSAPVAILDSLKNAGVNVLPLSNVVNALSVNMINVTHSSDTLWSQIARLNAQVYFLDASGPLTVNEDIRYISKLIHLRKLNLSYTSITDSFIVQLDSLQELSSLNIIGTKISDKGLEGLTKLKKLQHLYIFRTNVNPINLEKIKKLIPGVIIDTGGYTLPVLPGDTSEVKPKKT